MRDIDDSQAPLLDHLIELRRRLLYCVAALLVAFFACYAFAEVDVGADDVVLLEAFQSFEGLLDVAVDLYQDVVKKPQQVAIGKQAGE